MQIARIHGGDLGLFVTAKRFFGFWHKALSAADLDPHRESEAEHAADRREMLEAVASGRKTAR